METQLVAADCIPSEQYYIKFPSAVAQAMEFSKGEMLGLLPCPANHSSSPLILKSAVQLEIQTYFYHGLTDFTERCGLLITLWLHLTGE